MNMYFQEPMVRLILRFDEMLKVNSPAVIWKPCFIFLPVLVESNQ